MDNIARVNLIAGKNNVGKTALLEAIFMHCGAYNPSLTLSIDRFRGLDSIHIEFSGSKQSPWDSLFNNFDKSSEIEIKGTFTDGSIRKICLNVVQPSDEPLGRSPIIQLSPSTLGNTPLDTENNVVLNLTYEESVETNPDVKKSGSSFMVIGPKGVSTPIIKQPPFKTFFNPARFRISPEEDARRFSNLEIIGEENMLLDALKILEPRLKRVSVIASEGAPILYGEIGLSQMLRLPYMGDGMTKLASIILAIGNAKDGVVLVDEIENGFHHSMMQNVWDAIGRAAKHSNTQVFATTHSLECIIAAHNAFSKGEHYDFLVHRLNRIDNEVRDITFDQGDLDIAFKSKMDVR